MIKQMFLQGNANSLNSKEYRYLTNEKDREFHTVYKEIRFKHRKLEYWLYFDGRNQIQAVSIKMYVLWSTCKYLLTLLYL